MPQPAKVLVVEDEFVIALDLAQQLKESGFVIIGPASNASKALSLIDLDLPDFALLDVNLGSGKTSYEIARRLIDCSVPFVFLSGYTTAEVAREFVNVPVLAKPCPVDDVLGLIAMLRLREETVPSD